MKKNRLKCVYLHADHYKFLVFQIRVVVENIGF